MEEATEQYLKALKHALSSFEKAKEWHWSDLIKWLKKVEGIVSKSPPNVSRVSKEAVSVLIMLAKRLAQCLNPVLPQGLHSNALDIYNLLLKNKAPTFVDEELMAYSAGLFPFFQYASPQNKTKLLDIYRTYYLNYGQNVAFLVSGLVTSVVTGLEDQGSPETVQSVYVLFDGISGIGQTMLSDAVWMALLRTPKARAGCLIYLTKRKDIPIPNKFLVINALVAGLSDSNILIQRMTLDLVKSQFPLGSDLLSAEDKVVLLEAALKLLKKQDFTIMRRIWEWTNCLEMTAEHERNFMQILEPALKNIFDCDPKSKDEAKAPLDILKTILDQETLERPVLEVATVTVVKFLYRTRNLDDLCQFVFKRTDEVFEGDRAEFIWKSLHRFFSTETTNVLATLEIIKYTIQTYPLAMAHSHELFPLLTALLRRMNSCPPEALTISLELANQLLGKVDEKPKSTGFQDFFVQLCNRNPGIQQVGLGADICLSLGEVGLWVQCLISTTQLEDVQMALVGIEKTIQLLGYEKYQYSLREDVRLSILRRLWSLIDSTLGLKSVSLLISFHKVSRSEFASFLASALVSMEVANKVLAIRRFTIFWKTTNENWQDQLGVIFEKGEGVFNMLDHLENESPLVRHSAREWLLDAIPCFSAVLDPLVAILMHKDVTRQADSSGRLFYMQEYDSRRVLDALRKLRSLLLSGGDDVPQCLSRLKISGRAENAGGSPEKTYLVLVLEITLGFVQGEVQKSGRKGFEIDNQSVQSAACEVLELLLRKGDADLGYLAVGKVLETMCYSIREENTIMQLQLLNLLSLIFFECNISASRPQCKELLMSNRFATALLEGIHTKDPYLRLHWVEFLNRALDLVTAYLTHPTLTHYIGSLLHSLCEIIQRNPIKSYLFRGLSSVVRKTLELPERYQRGEKVLIDTHGSPSLAVKTSSLLDGVMRIFGKEERPMEASNPFFEVVNMVFQELDTIFLTCLSCLKPGQLPPSVTSRGTCTIETLEKPIDSATMNDLTPLLQPILTQFPSQFLASFLGLWFNSANAESSLEADLRVSGLLKLLVALKPNPYFLISGCLSYIRETLDVARMDPGNFRDLVIAHFLCSVLYLYPMSDFQLTADEEKDFLKAIGHIFQELESSQKPEMAMWLFDLFRIVVQKLQFRCLLEDKKLRKEFTGYFKKMVDACIRVCLERSEPAKFPYPPAVYAIKQKQCSLQESAFYVLEAGLYNIATSLYPSESTSKLMTQLEGPVSLLLKAMWTKTAPMDLISQLLFSLLEHSREYVSRLIKKDVIDFLNSADFFEAVKSKVALKCWEKIVSIVIQYCFPKKQELISEFFDKLPSGVFVSRGNEISHKARALKAVTFLLYSCETDDFQTCIDVLTEQIIDYLKLDEPKLLSPIFFAFRVIMVKFSQVQLEDIWPRLWPHFFAELMSLFKQERSYQDKLEGMKLIELLSVLGLEEFQLYQWIFFYDIMQLKLEANSDPGQNTFKPIVAAEFLKGLVHHLPLDGDLDNQRLIIATMNLCREVNPRPLVITQQKINEDAELVAKVQKIIQTIVISNGERNQPDWNSINEVLQTDFLYGGDNQPFD